VRGTSFQAARLGAMHALVLAHEPLQTIFGLDLIEPDQVPEVPCRVRHGLIVVGKSGVAELVAIPLKTRDLAGFAADAGGGIHQFADVVVPRDAAARCSTAVTGDRFYFQCSIAHGVSPQAFSIFTRKPLNSGV